MSQLPRSSPSVAMLAQLVASLRSHAPFAQMLRAHVELLVQAATARYFAPNEVLIQPSDGLVRTLFIIKQGRVLGLSTSAEQTADLSSGECFPIGALLAKRSAMNTYTAADDTFVLEVSAEAVNQVIALSPVFSDYATRRMRNLLDLSRQSLAQSYAAQSLAEQSMEAPLGTLASRAPVSCALDTPIRSALEQMQQHRVGSVLVCDEAGQLQGILTRHDVLDRIVLSGIDLAASISCVMSSPVQTLDIRATAQDAALLMSRERLRHVPLTEGLSRTPVGVVSERDLFGLQRLTINAVSQSLHRAASVEQVVRAAPEIRRLANALLAQGVHARQLTALISHLNDALTARLVALLASTHQIPTERFCWLAFGSEGRSEQTIATDQDNGLVLSPELERGRALAFAEAVNAALDTAGYPLCRGQIMASNPDCALQAEEWRARFAGWISVGSPEDLLHANVFFDMRPIAGNTALASGLLDEVRLQCQGAPRFLHLLAANALRSKPPLSWLGSIVTENVAGVDTVDLKLQGTAPFVEAARIFSLAHGVAACNTADRLRALAEPMRLGESEVASYIEAFEYILMQRLRVQLEHRAVGSDANRIAAEDLSELDRRILKETFRQARKLQQRLEMDFKA